MAAKALMYALPYHLHKEYSIGRYGMHGTSNLFVTHEAAKILNKPIAVLKVICAHLGNGASVTVIKKGQSVDASMEMTQWWELVVVGLDPSIIEYLMTRLDYSIEGVMGMLQNKVACLAFLVFPAISGDFREIIPGYGQGSKVAKEPH